jgi:prepilin-type N-terminal cleavage/methylation domain-containing protein
MIGPEREIPAAHRKHRCAALLFGRARGFSLIEMVIVAVILSIGAAIAVPRYAASLAEYRVEAAARRLQSDFAAARASARAQSASSTVRFRAGGYEIAEMKALDSGGRYAVDLRTEPYRLSTFTPEFGGDDFLRFDGYGNPARGGSVLLRAGSAGRRVIVDPVTGLARSERAP